MKTVRVDDLDNRVKADTEARASQQGTTSRFGISLSNIMRWARHRRVRPRERRTWAGLSEAAAPGAAATWHQGKAA